MSKFLAKGFRLEIVTRDQYGGVVERHIYPEDDDHRLDMILELHTDGQAVREARITHLSEDMRRLLAQALQRTGV